MYHETRDKVQGTGYRDSSQKNLSQQHPRCFLGPPFLSVVYNNLFSKTKHHKPSRLDSGHCRVFITKVWVENLNQQINGLSSVLVKP